MTALVPVAERSQPVAAVPLCQSSATGKFEFQLSDSQVAVELYSSDKEVAVQWQLSDCPVVFKWQ